MAFEPRTPNELPSNRDFPFVCVKAESVESVVEIEAAQASKEEKYMLKLTSMHREMSFVEKTKG